MASCGLCGGRQQAWLTVGVADGTGAGGAPRTSPPLPVGLATADFEALYARHHPRLVRALRLSGAGAEAEDVAQEAFARTLLHWWRVRRGTNPAGYAYRVAFRLARRRLGRPVRSDPAPVAPDAIAEATTRVDLERCLERMPPARRSCAVLVLLVGLPPVEVARALRIAPSTVRKQVSLARAELAASFRPAAREEGRAVPGI